MAEIKVCPVCGREFTDQDRKYCSPKCSKEGYRRRQADYSIKKYHTEKESRQGEARRTKKLSPLEEKSRRAREAGLSYGQYVALEYARIKKGLISKCQT